jgi:type II secretory pathway component PulC
MRLRVLVLALGSALVSACGPKIATTPLSFDEDLQERQPEAAPVEELVAERPVAPPGKGLRSGTITRPRLIEVLDAGPASFLRQLEVAPRLHGERFVGWELVQLVAQDSPLYDVDVLPGDVLLTINGKSVSRPDQLQGVWDSLRTANEVTAELWRGPTKLTLAFAVEPRI